MHLMLFFKIIILNKYFKIKFNNLITILSETLREVLINKLYVC